MFNEAFWFMYFVDLVDATEGIAIVAFLVAIIFATCYGVYTSETDDTAEGWARWFRYVRLAAIGAFAFMLIAILVPSEKTLYAGAGQYVVEATETDDTLMNLKRLVDQRIAEELE
jgi:hypothetical protein